VRMGVRSEMEPAKRVSIVDELGGVECLIGG